jgi:cytochrome P450 family 142 subfamily A polypeptide 1
MQTDVDFLAGKSWDDSMPERLAWLRENEPVFWSEATGLWVLSSFEHVAYASKHQEIFTSTHGVRPGVDAKIGLIDEGEPRHGLLRKLINKGFTPRMVKKWEVIFRRLVSEAIDEFASKGECDVVEAFSVPVPLLLIAEMIGIRKEDRERFHHWSDSMIAADGHMDDPEVTAAAGQSFLEYATYVTAIIEDRRAHPKEDLVSILVGAKDQGLLKTFADGDRGDRSEEEVELANDELIKLLVILLVAGNETTRNGITGGMQLLIENPDQRKRLIDDPSLITNAVEEMVRLISPVKTFSRTVIQDTEIGGKTMKTGDKILMVYPSANTDPSVFENPLAFDPARSAQHLGFGVGSHFCLGANLARMEMRVAFEELLRRVPDMEYSRGGPEFRPSPLVRTCTHMHVRFSPVRSGEKAA